MHVVFVINDSSVLVYPAFLRTIILTVPSFRELLLMVNKSANDEEFLNEHNGGLLPPGCHYAGIVKVLERCAALLLLYFPSPFFLLLSLLPPPLQSWSQHKPQSRQVFAASSCPRSCVKHVSPLNPSTNPFRKAMSVSF